jgi:hypothetical protein
MLCSGRGGGREGDSKRVERSGRGGSNCEVSGELNDPQPSGVDWKESSAELSLIGVWSSITSSSNMNFVQVAGVALVIQAN